MATKKTTAKKTGVKPRATRKKEHRCENKNTAEKIVQKHLQKFFDECSEEIAANDICPVCFTEAVVKHSGRLIQLMYRELLRFSVDQATEGSKDK